MTMTQIGQVQTTWVSTGQGLTKYDPQTKMTQSLYFYMTHKLRITFYIFKLYICMYKIFYDMEVL